MDLRSKLPTSLKSHLIASGTTPFVRWSESLSTSSNTEPDLSTATSSRDDEDTTIVRKRRESSDEMQSHDAPLQVKELQSDGHKVNSIKRAPSEFLDKEDFECTLCRR